MVIVPSYVAVVIVVSAFVVAGVLWLGLRRAFAGLNVPGEQQRAVLAIVGVFLGGWLLLALALAVSGFFEPDLAVWVPTIAYAALPVMAGYALVVSWPVLRLVVEVVPQRWMIGVQVYRVLGVLFLILYAQGRLPGEFALSAGIGDVLVGVAAPVVAYLLMAGHERARLLAVAWNVAGIADLVLAVGLGFLTTPGRFQLLALGAPNELILAFPLVLIPSFAVPLSILLHMLSLRMLLRQRAMPIVEERIPV